MREQPLVFNIHRLSTDDGPGLRSTVFLKGCPLACDWCHNPESISASPEVTFTAKLCIGCGACARVCPEEAINLEGNDRVIRDRCSGCGNCADVCPSMALRRRGIHYPVQELVSLLMRDRLFYEVSGGGVTFSGGEPTQHMDYLELVLVALAREGVHTAIQTCGAFSLEPFVQRILPLVDLIFFDLKLFDEKEHRRFIGGDNTLIFENFRALSCTAREKIVPRIPLIPERTASRHNLIKLAGFLLEQGYRNCDLLSFNPGGHGKRQQLGLTAPSDIPESFLDVGLEKEMRDLFACALRGQGSSS